MARLPAEDGVTTLADKDKNEREEPGEKGCGKKVNCDDANPCTVDSCVHGRGCQHATAPVGTSCDDGNLCTTNDTCSATHCAGTGVLCGAADQCHVAGTCNPATGACPVAPSKTDGTVCNDNNACTSSDTCQAGLCGAPQAASFTFTEINYPGSINMGAAGINTYGDIVGLYQLDDGVVHGFLFHAGAFTTVDRPGAVNGTYLTAIDDHGRILGWTNDDTIHPFIWENGTFTTIAALDNANNIPVGWNEAGDIVGVYGESAFLFRNGVQTQVTPSPGADITGATDISGTGDIVGYSLNVDTGGQTLNNRGFLLRGGVFTNIDVPGAMSTSISGISGSAVAGTTQSQDFVTHAFVYQDAVFTIIDAPSSLTTYAGAINSTGQVVGAFTHNFDAPFNTSVFLTTPKTRTCSAP